MRLGSAKKIIVSLITLLSISFVIIAAVVIYMIHSSTRRPVYSKARQEEHRLNHALLINTFGAQAVKFSTPDDLNLAGLLLIRPQAQRTLLLCHGYRMCKERMCAFAQLFPDDNIFMFDYRAHGESPGNCTSIGYHEKKDVLAAVAFLQNHPQLKNIPIIGLGISMGAVSLCAAAAECKLFKALIFDSPFAQLDKQAQRVLHKRYKLPSIPFETLGRYLFSYVMQFSLSDVNTLRWISDIQVPVLLIHSTQDQTASFDDAKLLYEQLQTTHKEFWVVEGSGHARIVADYPEQYRQKLSAFFSSINI